jgi:ATP-binding cassette subfamily F protein 3
MLLIPSNTLLLDEPTNHLDLDSKDILLEALEDYGGTLVFVSHDRYFVEKLATKIVEIGHGDALVFPGTYPEFLWSKERRETADAVGLSAEARRAKADAKKPAAAEKRDSALDHAERRRQAAQERKREQAARNAQSRVTDLENRIAEREQAMKEIEAAMSAPGFYENRDQAQPLIDRHQALMWELGELMHQWEELQK